MNKESQWLLREKYQGVETPEFFVDRERLAAGEPLGYVIGHVPFLDCQIWLDSKPLIPRPETEFWVEKAIAAICGLVAAGGGPKAPRVLDLCAGSGAIGVAVAKAIPETHVTFAEIDPTHLPTILKNLRENVIEQHRYEALASDLFRQINGTFDAILCNPPYIDVAARTVTESVAVHEPHLALFGGEGGMEVIARIIVEARAKLAPHGALWLEHEPFQTTALAKLAHQHGFTVATYPDQYGTARYSVLANPVAE